MFKDNKKSKRNPMALTVTFDNVDVKLPLQKQQNETKTSLPKLSFAGMVPPSQEPASPINSSRMNMTYQPSFE